MPDVRRYLWAYKQPNMMLDDIFLEWYCAETVLEEMALIRSRIRHFHVPGNAFLNEKINI